MIEAKNITDPEIRAYLLGNISEEAANRIDELTFTDDDFAARVGAIERDLIDEYLRKELDEETLRRFESYYLNSPLRRERVRLGSSINQYVADGVRVTDHPIRAETESKTETRWFDTWWKIAVPAFAALVLIAVGAPLLLQRTDQPIANTTTDENRNAVIDPSQLARSTDVNVPTPSSSVSPANDNNSNRPPTPEPKEEQRKPAPSVFAVTLVPQLRSSSGVPQVSIPTGTERLAITLKLEPTEYSIVRVQVKNASGAVIWRGSSRLSRIMSGYQSVTLSVPTRSLTAGSYTVTALGPGGGDDVIGDYGFRVAP